MGGARLLVAGCFAALALGLAGCMAPSESAQSANAPAQKISAGGFEFHVTHTNTVATARNYHTGRLNFAALQESAIQAIQTASGCPVRTIAKRGELNTFDATLACPAG
ncbi:MAG: hypothetical protein ACRBBK_06835 [Paracoccaceae bacterium]